MFYFVAHVLRKEAANLRLVTVKKSYLLHIIESAVIPALTLPQATGTHQQTHQYFFEMTDR